MTHTDLEKRQILALFGDVETAVFAAELVAAIAGDGLNHSYDATVRAKIILHNVAQVMLNQRGELPSGWLFHDYDNLIGSAPGDGDLIRAIYGLLPESMIPTWETCDEIARTGRPVIREDTLDEFA